MEMLMLMAAPFAVCLILTGIHCYLGLHIVTRGVIFVDLALAQIAAFGAILALFFGYELTGIHAYIFSLLFTFVGAGILALGRFREKVVPQEAIIGIVYAVFSAAAILVLDRAPHGHEAMKAMLVGSILYVNWPEVLKILLIYLAVGAFHFLFPPEIFSHIPGCGRGEEAGSCSYVLGLSFLYYLRFCRNQFSEDRRRAFSFQLPCCACNLRHAFGKGNIKKACARLDNRVFSQYLWLVFFGKMGPAHRRIGRHMFRLCLGHIRRCVGLFGKEKLI